MNRTKSFAIGVAAILVAMSAIGCGGPIERSDPNNNFAADREKRRANKVASANSTSRPVGQ
ncbi:hypothetical protein [Fimbriimonas ginsengisoli]|uniref:hypothetical protein n=1 Tax=Fimbriimonas ginsengisoli TaxID=1005039 RepID=UPI0011871B26|nr:hypothetical protein [Fimbriimonas ginsengisoli]